MATELEELKKKFDTLNLTTSHTKRSTIENGLKIQKVQDTIEGIHDEWVIVVSKLTGDEGYFKQTIQNGVDIELHEIRLSKQDIKLIKILVFGITAGLVMGWLISQYNYESKKRQETYLYHQKEDTDVVRKLTKNKI